ncbi:unnamed protein product [Brachionus calyciflorus]|uniref:Uncharacterized protein n=1 Tax=Brachionus calyciflorus TaxID=104777 RepID=A0A813QNS4_9BILA|nr:unnamed protein product [Brachionus calyciflorus]
MYFPNGELVTQKDLKYFFNHSRPFKALPLRVYDKDQYLINVLPDGWCLLYSFQVSYEANSNQYLEINQILQGLLIEFRNKCLTKSLPYDFFTLDEDNSQSISSSNESVEEIFKFFLIRYIHQKHYNSFVLDYIPQLLADYFECNIDIYSYTTDNKLIILNEFKCGKKDDNNLTVSILYCSEFSHFMAFCPKLIKYPLTKLDNIRIDLDDDFYMTVIKLYKNSIFYFKQ